MYLRILIISFLIIFLFNSCKENSTEPQNSPPSIEQIILNPTSTTPGNIVKLSCVVTDKEGDAIQYTWVPSKGTVSQSNIQNPDWNIPADVTVNSSITITLNVTDGKQSSSKNATLQIIKGISIQGYVYYSGTTIPVSGATVIIGAISKSTGSDGKYIFDNIPSGTNTIKVIKTGYDTYETTINVSSTNNKFNFPITSSTDTKKLYGTIKTIDNIRLNGVRISVLNPDDTESGLTEISDVNGNYQIASVPQGTRKVKLTNVNNSYNCKESIQEVFVANFDKNYDARVKILRQGNFADKNAVWETSNSNITVSWNSNNYWLFSITTPEFSNVRLKNGFNIPSDAEDGTLVMYSSVLNGPEYYNFGWWPRIFLIDKDTWPSGTGQYWYYNNASEHYSNFDFETVKGNNKTICFTLSHSNGGTTKQELKVRTIDFKYYW